jgi:hypothetical protein
MGEQRESRAKGTGRNLVYKEWDNRFVGVMGVMADGILGGTTVSWERLGKICQSCAKFVRAVQNLSG